MIEVRGIDLVVVGTHGEHPTIGKVRSIANPCQLAATPPLYRYPPPLLGEHTAAVLENLEYSPEDIASAKRDAVI